MSRKKLINDIKGANSMKSLPIRLFEKNLDKRFLIRLKKG